MKTSEHIDELAAALMVVQNTVGNLPKTAKGYGYSYTPLDEVTSALSDPLAENGLSFVQMPSNIEGFVGIVLTTRLMHVSGQWLEDKMIMPIPDLAKGNEAQAYGAGLTYARRYALTAMFGIASDEDTDARPTPGNNRPSKPAAQTGNLQPPMPTDAMKKKFHATGVDCYGDEWDDKRPALVSAVTAKRNPAPNEVITSSNDLYRAEMQHLIDGMQEKIADRIVKEEE